MSRAVRTLKLCGHRVLGLWVALIHLTWTYLLHERQRTAHVFFLLDGELVGHEPYVVRLSTPGVWPLRLHFDHMPDKPLRADEIIVRDSVYGEIRQPFEFALGVGDKLCIDVVMWPTRWKRESSIEAREHMSSIFNGWSNQ